VEVLFERLVNIALFILFGAVSVFIINKIFAGILKKNNNIHLKFLKSLSNSILIVVVIYVYLSQFDATKSISKTIMQSGTLLIALVTFAAQKVLGNVISGIDITLTKPFDVGDKISLLNGSTPVCTGVVMDINTRHTSIKMTDGKVAIITNSLIDSYICINENVLDKNGYPLVMECTFDSDVDLAKQLMQEEIDKHPLTLTTGLNQANVTCSGITANGFELKAIVFTENIANNVRACSDLRVSIFKVWKENNIELPYETITIQGGL
jgi:small-conductance mechanosensitive channel